MKRLAQLYQRLDQTNRTSEKTEALRAYFEETPAQDAVWTLYFLSGRRIKRAVSYRILQEEAARRSDLPTWMLAECRQTVGDLAETIALLLPETEVQEPLSLNVLVERFLLPMPGSSDEQRRRLLNQAWDGLDAWQRFVFHKLISGSLRIGVAQRLLVRGFAAAVDVEPEVIAHRMTGRWEPTAETFRMLVEGDASLDALRPYPFCLATQQHGSPEALGEPNAYLAEWKWDGIRAQMIRRNGQTGLWSRGEEAIDGAFPELMDLGGQLPEGTVLDGEVLAWDFEQDRPMSFASLQKRLNRKEVPPTLFGPEIPVVFRAYDLLELDGVDLRGEPIVQRRRQLEEVVNGADDRLLGVSEVIGFETWEELGALREEARERGVEGVMLKRKDSAYQTGRRAGSWWKWKVAPHTVDAVLVAAQQGHGERAGVFSDYTFAVWDGEELVTLAKAYSGLTNEEIDKVSRWVRSHTTGRFGPVHAVDPEHVFELAFEGIQESSRHKAGLALRFPRILRWRTDKKPAEADRLETLRKMLDDA